MCFNIVKFNINVANRPLDWSRGYYARSITRISLKSINLGFCDGSVNICTNFSQVYRLLQHRCWWKYHTLLVIIRSREGFISSSICNIIIYSCFKILNSFKWHSLYTRTETLQLNIISRMENWTIDDLCSYMYLKILHPITVYTWEKY